MKHYEVATYKLRPTFGSSNLGFWVNLDKWGKLSAEEQEILVKAAIKTEIEMPAIGDKILAKESMELEKLGVKTEMLAPDTAKKVKETFAASMWEIAKKCCADGLELRSMAQKAGLTN